MSVQSPDETQFESNIGLTFTRSEMKLESCTKNLNELDENFINNFIDDLAELCDLYRIELISGSAGGTVMIKDEEGKEFIIDQVQH